MAIEIASEQKFSRRWVGTPAIVKFGLLLTLFVAINGFVIGGNRGDLGIFLMLIDLGFVLPLFVDFFAALANAYFILALMVSGLRPDFTVFGKDGRILAIDRNKGKIFANCMVRDLSAIRTAHWFTQNKVVQVELNFADRRGALSRIHVGTEYQAADVVAEICDAADLTLQ